MASFNLSSVWRSPGSQYSSTSLPLKFNMFSSSCDVLAWSRRDVANSWHCFLISCKIRHFKTDRRKNVTLYLTLYSTRNSVSIRLNLLNSQDNSKAVRIGSLELRAIKLLDDNARYELIRAWEWRKESWSLEETHSSHPQLLNANKVVFINRLMDKQNFRPWLITIFWSKVNSVYWLGSSVLLAIISSGHWVT